VGHGGTVAECWRWPQPTGPSLWWVASHSAGAPLTPAAHVEVARSLAGDVVATDDLDVSAAMADAGMPLVRHAHVMSADPAVVASYDVRADLRLAPLAEASLEQLADLRISAFPPGHPDHAQDTREARVAAYSRELEDPESPVHEASRSAWLGDELVGTCLVVDARHFPGHVGPWVQSVARRPGEETRGVGAALLVSSAHGIAEEGGTYVGLAVTDSNPARMLYERMGWSGRQMWLHLVPEVGR
jgi:GNAT superfamily N-acetyltransferase